MNILKRLFSKKKESEERAYPPNQRPHYDFPPSFNETKKAIFIGLNYPHSFYSLQGCINDVKNGAEFLKGKGYETKVLTDSDISEHYDIIQSLIELRHYDGKNVFFHYSGHGSQTQDLNGDEDDGMDEAVCMNGGLVTDDKINESLALYPKEKNLVLIFDCCHSGSIADLPFYIQGKKVVSQKGREIKANIICISGCKDNQTSADVCDKNLAYGALSATFYELLRQQKTSITWKNFYFKLLKEMEKRNYEQIPMISASNPKLFDQKVTF